MVTMLWEKYVPSGFETEKPQAQVVDALDFTTKERVPSPNCVDMFDAFDLQHIFPIDFFLLIVSQPTKISTWSLP